MGEGMNRRRFLQNLAVTTAGAPYLTMGGAAKPTDPLENEFGGDFRPHPSTAEAANIEGHTMLAEFKLGPATWKAYEDLRTRDGAITFVSSQGKVRILAKSAEATFSDVEPAYLGLSLDDIGVSGPDLLADRLLEDGGDPDPERVKLAAPPLESKITKREEWGERLPWNTFVGTKECFDTMPVTPRGSTRTYHPDQHFPELNAKAAQQRFEGLVGGWMPAVRKVFPLTETAYIEVVVFGDVEAKDKFIVQTWHRTAKIEDRKIASVFYGYSYPAFPPSRLEPQGEEFYRGLLVFAEYWEKQLGDFAPAELPDASWIHMAKHAFAKELMVRPGGVYPKYGAVDRDYYGPEYDGFQDIFTSAVYTNLEWGRFAAARAIIDNYFSDFVDAKGNVNMRGPETAQYGLELSLLARYFRYTKDSALLLKHRGKIEATAEILTRLHEESLKLPQDDVGYGLIHGWSESDSALHPKPMTWWLPYYGNSAFAARGLKDISRVWAEIEREKPTTGLKTRAGEWSLRSDALRDALVAAMRENVRTGMTPAYIGPYAGSPGKFRETFKKSEVPVQLWAHRPYCELLQADMLPDDLANLVIDCMRGYGATTLGVVANVGPAEPKSRAILGFISYGYAQELLRLDRVEEYLLFLYSHRYHDHNPGSWTAGEVSGLEGDASLFCLPAQQTIPLLVRWMLVFEDSDEETLYLGKGLPREWLGSGKEIAIDGAPTRWGRVHFKIAANLGAKRIEATVQLAKGEAPKEVHVKLRLPVANKLAAVTVNGKACVLGGRRKDTVIVTVGNERAFEVVGQLS
jgi:hypothetical protein